MAGSVTVPNQFQAQNGPIPLSQLDNNFTALSGPLNAAATFSNYYVDSSGAANTLTVTISSPQTFSYTAGVRLDVKLSNTNTSSTVNINVNSLGNQAIVNGDGTSVAVGQLVAGMILSLMYNGTNFLLIGAASKPASIAPFTSTAAGNVTLPAPTSGTALAVVGATGAFYTATFANLQNCVVENSAGNGYAPSYNLLINAFASVNTTINGTASTDVNGIPPFYFGIGTAANIGFAVGINGATKFSISPAGAITFTGASLQSSYNFSGAQGSSSATAGSASALPAAPSAYWAMQVNGTNYKIPLYNN
jgi:hypothetical protein